MKKYIILFLLLIALPCWGADVHIRDGATGTWATTQCDTWASDRACDDLPTSLVRGNTYWFADGNYGGYHFQSSNAANSGTTAITLKKATASAHGSATGWDNAYGDGQAIFQQPDLFDNVYRKAVFYIRVSYITIDGVVGSGSDPDTYGFKFLQHPSYGDADNPAGYLSGYEMIAIGGQNGSNLTIQGVKILHSAVIGAGVTDCYDATPYKCSSEGIRAYTSITAGGYMSDIEIGDTYTYGNTQNIDVNGVVDAVIHDNYLTGNVSHSVGSHGENMNLDTDTNPKVYNNTFANSVTFAIGIHNGNNGGTGLITNAQVYNNLIIGGTLDGCITEMTSTTRDVVHSSYFHHNTVINTNCGRGFVHVGNVTDLDTQKSYSYNNLFYNSVNVDFINTTRTSGAIVHDNNAYMKCTGNYSGNGTLDAEAAGQVDTGDHPTIFTNYATGDYTIAAADQTAIDHIIGKGKTLASPFDIDYSGVSRTAPFDIGAYDVGGSADATAPTLAEVTPVSTPSSNQASQYVFSSNEEGTVTYGGTCGNGSLSTAIVGNNTTQWNLGVGTYSNCTITVTDAAANASTPLAITEFVITPTDASAAKTIEGGVSFQQIP